MAHAAQALHTSTSLSVGGFFHAEGGILSCLLNLKQLLDHGLQTLFHKCLLLIHQLMQSIVRFVLVLKGVSKFASAPIANATCSAPSSTCKVAIIAEAWHSFLDNSEQNSG